MGELSDFRPGFYATLTQGSYFGRTRCTVESVDDHRVSVRFGFKSSTMRVPPAHLELACLYIDCDQGPNHHPHDWARNVDDDEWDWLDYLNSRSARERGDLVCGVCNQQWPCETKRAHVAARSAGKRG